MKKMMVTMLVVLLVSTGVFAGENEAKYLFSAYPAGYELKNGPATALSIVETDGGKALQFKAADITYVRIRSPFQTLKPATKYVLSYQVKVTDFKTKKGKHPDGVMVQIVSSAGKPYVWINVSGSGTTEGWVTAYLPFDTGAKPAFVKSRMQIFFGKISGTVLLRKLKIEAVDAANFPKNRYFKIGEDKVSGGVLKL